MAYNTKLKKTDSRYDRKKVVTKQNKSITRMYKV